MAELFDSGSFPDETGTISGTLLTVTEAGIYAARFAIGDDWDAGRTFRGFVFHALGGGLYGESADDAAFGAIASPYDTAELAPRFLNVNDELAYAFGGSGSVDILWWIFKA